jgi:hypothetical protein
VIIKAESGLADSEDGIVLDALSSEKSDLDRDITFSVFSKKDAFLDGYLHICLEDLSDYEVTIFNGSEWTEFNKESADIVAIRFNKKDEAEKMIKCFAKEGKDWHDYLHGIKDAETLQSITYRAFELAESAIKAAIAQAIEEQFND